MRGFRRDCVPFSREFRGCNQHDLPPLFGLELVAAVGVGRGRAPLGKRLWVATLLANPRRHASLSEWRTRGKIDDMAGQCAARLGDDCQPRHPHKRSAHQIVGATEVGLVAGNEPIGPGLERFGSEGLGHR